MSDFDPDYIYIPVSYEGHRPANRRVCQHFQRGTVYAIPKGTTMFLELARGLRSTKDEAYADAAKQDAGAEVSVTPIPEGIEYGSPEYWAHLQDNAGKDRP